LPTERPHYDFAIRPLTALIQGAFWCEFAAAVQGTSVTSKSLIVLAAGAACAALVAGCATASTGSSGKNADKSPPKPLPQGLSPAVDPFPSTYQRLGSRPTAIVNANILTATGQEIRGGMLVMAEGKIVSVGPAGAPPSGHEVIDAAGKWVTPGVIDAHSHLGSSAAPAVPALNDTNEATTPNTAQVWVEHSVWPQDPGFNTARAGGVTAMMILPGSANLFGGRSVTIKNVPARNVQAMKFPGAPYGLKMACGENPSRVYGNRNQSPATGMGNVAGYRTAFINAADYARKWDDYNEKVAKGEKAEAPKRDLQLETLAGVLKGDILVQNHCYRADEMAVMLDVAREFGYKTRTFHHASEAYKIADVLAREDVCVATWAGWWGFKLESLDGIEENAPLVHAAGGCAVIHSDDPDLTQRLNQESAVALSSARRAGLDIPKAEAVKWFTANPAKAIGVLNQTGTLEPGKMADVVIWSADPFSVYAKAEKVFIDGALVYDRADPRFQPKSDFELGQPGSRRLP
jgi:imidazolonepropionase-like amidohydrolase